MLLKLMKEKSHSVSSNLNIDGFKLDEFMFDLK